MFSSGKNNAPESKDAAGLEKLVKKATDETLTTDNWQYLLDVCDKISQDPEILSKQAIKFISARLALKDANVLLRTLSLVVAIAENCGSRIKQEIATSSFLNDSILKKLNDRKIHVTVKYKIAEVIKQLYDTFKTDPSLRPMTVAYEKLEQSYPQYLSSRSGAIGSANGVVPHKPAKQEILEADKAKEEEELQRVLRDSLREYEREQDLKHAYLNKPLPEATDNENIRANGGANTPPEQTIATVSKVRALYDLISYEPDELSFRKNDIITVLESVYRDWWKGSLPSGEVGIFPLNYVTPVVTKSSKELAMESEIELKIFSVDLKNVEKLLALLSSPNQENINEDEVTRLYNDIIPIRPTLGKFLEKYSVRKEELFQLNTQLNSEAKLYNDLMEKLISQRAHLAQQQTHNGHVPYPHIEQPLYSQQQQPQYTQPPAPQQQQQYTQPPPQQYTQAPPQQSPQQQQHAQSQYQQNHQQANQLQLLSQPTSTGFGNANPDYSQYQRISSPSQNFFAPQYPNKQNQVPLGAQQLQDYQQQFTPQPLAHTDTSQQLFLNINRFPDVQNI